VLVSSSEVSQDEIRDVKTIFLKVCSKRLPFVASPLFIDFIKIHRLPTNYQVYSILRC